MMIDQPIKTTMIEKLLDNCSLEITARDIDRLAEAAPAIVRGSMISITFLPGESFSTRIEAAKQVEALGFRPVPHLSARRLESMSELEAFLDGLASSIKLDKVFVIAGDLSSTLGPFQDALA